MWGILNEIVSNTSRGLSGAIKASTAVNSVINDVVNMSSKYLSNTTPPPQVIVDPALEAARKQERWERETKLIEDFLSRNQISEFNALSQEIKRKTSRALINDLKVMQENGYDIPQNIKDIINTYNDGDIFEGYKVLGQIKQFYVDAQRKEEDEEKRKETKNKNLIKPETSYSAHTGQIDSTPRTQFPPRATNKVTSSRSQTGAQNRCPSKACPQVHPAGLKPINNATALRKAAELQISKRKGYDQRDSGIENLEYTGRLLAGLQFKLSEIDQRRNNLYRVRNRPRDGSHNPTRTEEYEKEMLRIMKDMKSIEKNFPRDLDDINIIYAARAKELRRLNNTPSVRPSAPTIESKIFPIHLGHLHR